MSFNATFAFCHLFGCETAGIPPLRNDDILVIAAGSTDFDFVEVAYSAQAQSPSLLGEFSVTEILAKMWL